METKVTIKEVADKIKRKLREYPLGKFILSIGSDSQQYRKHTKSGETKNYITTAVAVVLLKDGGGHIFFYNKSKKGGRMALWPRMFHEANISLEVAQKLFKELKSYEDRFGKVRVETDIGEVGGTRDTIKAITGMVLGYGFDPLTKPDTVACRVADKMVRN